jgi:hypothetical protein
MRLAQISITTPSTIFQTSQYSSLVGLLTGRILLFAIGFAGLYFFVRLIISGFNYMTSMGDSAKIQASNQQMVNSLFGLLIVLSAYFLAQIVQYIFRLNFL